jgi:predicted PurR-regulated permease PerM
MSRRTVSLIVLALTLLLLLWLVPDVLLVVFAGALLGVFLHVGGGFIARHTRLPHGLGVLAFVLLLIGAGALLGLLAAQPLAEQANELWRQVPATVGSMTERLSHYSWGQELLQRLQPEKLNLPSGGGRSAFTILGSTFGALGDVVLIVFLGLYFAIDPGLYRRGIVLLLAPSLRPKAERVCQEIAETLRGWLGAQLTAMAVVGSLTGIGLWLVGIPLAPLLGVIAALLAFIPTIGPVLSAVPGVLLGLSQGGSGALLALGVYVGVQSLETYLITPFVQKRQVNLPEALTIVAQLGFGLLFGFMGLTLATPIAAVLLMLGRRLYVDDYLEVEPPGERRILPG